MVAACATSSLTRKLNGAKTPLICNLISAFIFVDDPPQNLKL